MTKAQIREIRQHLDLVRRLTAAATAPDAGDELVILCAAAHAALALDTVPRLLDEVERLQAGQRQTAPGFLKLDLRGGWA